MDVRDDYNQALPVLDIYLGLVYERGSFFATLGFEASAWMNGSIYLDFIDDISDAKNIRNTSDLMLSGAYLRCGWNWGGRSCY